MTYNGKDKHNTHTHKGWRGSSERMEEKQTLAVLVVEFIDIVPGRTGNYRVSGNRLVKEATYRVIRSDLGVGSLKSTRLRAQSHLERDRTRSYRRDRIKSGFTCYRKTLSVNRKRVTGWLTLQVNTPPVNGNHSGW